ncbi:MAG: T9SS type A sorting domain-containing protein [Bacteroidetes bacterium]|nr:T9SS type A sorting domain-containing protein [Bacteroidota bacterium]
MKAQKLVLVMVISLFSYTTTMAQIVLDINDLPDVGDVQISVKVDSTQGLMLQPGNSGNNVLWDFSNLLPCCGTVESSLDTMIWEEHTSTPNAAVFPLSNIVNKENCFIYHSHVTHVDETDCYYNHYIKDSTGLLYYGLEYPAKSTFNNYWNIFPLLTYGDSLQHTATIHIPISPDSVRVYHIDYLSVADAWGTVVTPTDTTVDAIRIYTTETVFDTLYVNGIVQQVSNYVGNYYYRWYTKNLGFPVLEIAKGMQTQQPPFFQKVSYAKELNIAIGIIDNTTALFEKIKIYPNPFDNNITIVQPFSKSSELIIYNVKGEIIYTTNISSQHIVKTEEWNEGIYFYQLRQGQEIVATGKIIKR